MISDRFWMIHGIAENPQPTGKCVKYISATGGVNAFPSRVLVQHVIMIIIIIIIIILLRRTLQSSKLWGPDDGRPRTPLRNSIWGMLPLGLYRGLFHRRCCGTSIGLVTLGLLVFLWQFSLVRILWCVAVLGSITFEYLTISYFSSFFCEIRVTKNLTRMTLVSLLYNRAVSLWYKIPIFICRHNEWPL